MLVGSTSEVGIGASLHTKLPYNTLRDLAPVTALASTPMVLVIHPSLPAKSVKQLIALAKAHPGELNYGSAGAGTGNHMSGELFRYLTKINIVHIPYKGAAPALADVVGGQVHMMFSTLPAAAEFVKARRLRALAVSSAQHAPSMSEIPTMAESGVPGYEVEYWYGFFAPAATPKNILARIHADTAEVLRLPDVVANFAKQGLEPVKKTQEQFAAFVKADIEKWAVVVKASGAEID
jgi:tripartite-type tricarboxylate transporter receptor subunit TctC